MPPLYTENEVQTLSGVGLGPVQTTNVQSKQSSANALTAFAGGGQASGTPITTKLSRFTTVATAADSATLPLAKAGASLTVINAAAANSMNVFPAVGDSINALSANTAFAMAANKTAVFFCAVDGIWNTVLTA